MKFASILFEEEEPSDMITIIGYHRNNNPDFSIADISMEPRVTRQSKRGRSNVGFYITMPKMSVKTV